MMRRYRQVDVKKGVMNYGNLEKGEMEGVKECLWTRPPLYLCNLSTVLQSER